jgi:DNA sulfur modification protein DndB
VKVTFPALKGTIGKRTYYATTMALSEIPRFFKFNDWEQADPALRAQRILNIARVPEIVRYMLDNEDGYIFSSITASYKADVKFIPSPSDDRIGTLEMDLEDMEFIINDGQHRAAAIAAALKENPGLGKERISVLLFETEDLSRLQQMFSDLNRFAHKTSRSMDILYDHRDNLSALTMEVSEQVPAFRGMVDKEKTSIPLRSPKLMTLSALYDANGELLDGTAIAAPGTSEFNQAVRTATDYWIEVSKVVLDWERVQKGKLQAPALRQEKINTHGVVLRALGGVGNALLRHHPDDWQQRLAVLKEVDWRKSTGSRVNPLWDNVCIVAGSVVSNRQARKATQAVLKSLLSLPLGTQERQILANLRQSGWTGVSKSSSESNGRAEDELLTSAGARPDSV